MTEHRSGFVGVLGQTNVGKSTFLNAVLGEKLLITSSKPQATRNRIRCVLTVPDGQIVFVDTPGLHQPKSTLSRYLVREAYRGLRGLDALLYVIEPWGRVNPFDRRVLERLEDTDRPVLLLVNKIDIAEGNALEETLLAYAEMEYIAELIPVSSTKGIGLDDAVNTVIRYLPERPPPFPPDIKCDRAEEFLIGEILREKAFQLTYQEVPYSIAARVKWLHEKENGLIVIRAEIVVERESQKGILVGKGGRMIKQIGTLARADIETLLGRRVFLDLVAKVRPGWTRDEEGIRQLTESA
jgi:GTP-binding protein Era